MATNLSPTPRKIRPLSHTRTSSVRPTPDAPSLTELVQSIKDGDDQHWSALVRRLTGPVRTALYRFDVDQQKRNEATAETWRILFEKLDSVNDPECLPGWIAVVARNKMLDVLRREQMINLYADLDEVNSPEGHQDEDHLVSSETCAALRGALARLSPKERAIVVGRVVTDHPESLRQMSDRLGIPQGSIGPTLGRSLTKLRQDPELRRFLLDGEVAA